MNEDIYEQADVEPPPLSRGEKVFSHFLLFLQEAAPNEFPRLKETPRKEARSRLILSILSATTFDKYVAIINHMFQTDYTASDIRTMLLEIRQGKLDHLIDSGIYGAL